MEVYTQRTTFIKIRLRERAVLNATCVDSEVEITDVQRGMTPWNM